MKTKQLAVPVVIACASLFATAAHASDGTINFTGELTSETCTINVDGQASPASVTLPTVSVNTLSTVGNTNGRTGFNIQLSQCSGTAKTAAAFFEAGPGVDPVSGNLLNSGGTAKGVALQLLDNATNGKVIQAGNSNQTQQSSQVTLDASGNATLPYAVQYYATGTTDGGSSSATATTSAGSVTGSVTYSLNYQ